MSLADQIRDEPSLPRSNGELVFDAPWQSRAFSVAVTLADSGRCDWDDFRGRLIAEIGAWEAEHGERDESWDYYAHWLTALERLLTEEGLVSEADLAAARAAAAHAQAHEHDHDHEHDHPH